MPAQLSPVSPCFKPESDYMPMPSGASSRKSLAKSASTSGLFASECLQGFLVEDPTGSLAGTKRRQTEKRTKAQADLPAPEKKRGTRRRVPHFCMDSADQNEKRTPKRNCRSSNLALLISMKLPLERSPLGLLKCGELKRFEESTRNCKSKRSVILTVRNRLKSKFTEPGPKRRLRPTLP